MRCHKGSDRPLENPDSPRAAHAGTAPPRPRTIALCALAATLAIGGLVVGCEEPDDDGLYGGQPVVPTTPTTQPTTTATTTATTPVVPNDPVDVTNGSLLPHAQKAYENWKIFLADCGDGSMRVQFSDVTATVSEGIAYGMLLAVAHNDSALFEGLWKYYNNFLTTRGLMNWRISGCTSVSGGGSASDADLDVAAALIEAECKWGGGGYANAARIVASNILASEVATVNGTVVLKAGDGADSACLNVSYFSPAYYRAFAKLNPAEAGTWNALINDSYVVLNRSTNTSSGLVPNWSSPAGVANCRGASGALYGYDAARTPWRIGTDYLWWNAPEAKAWLTLSSNWAASQGIATIVDEYTTAGEKLGDWHSSVFVGAFAIGAMAVDTPRANEFFTEFVAMKDGGYFPWSLRAVYLAFAAGLLPRPSCI